MLYRNQDTGSKRLSVLPTAPLKKGVNRKRAGKEEKKGRRKGSTDQIGTRNLQLI
ncbi:MAG TPA: hypothetical protein VK133_02365 [Amoebophilaceae bacterium]|jgi:hypothetical protein|nr:hypothetical protein [Amoebophilaceae bacterium]